MDDSIIVVVFSKDRALQLDACLSSYRLHCNDSLNYKKRVIFKCSDLDSKRQYDTLKSEHPEVQFIEETDFCRDLVSAIEGSAFVLFLVDDNLFVGSFLLQGIASLIERYADAIGFSLRLGRNITSCYSHGDIPQSIPDAERVGQNSLRFRWTEGVYDFGYPLEVSSSVFRTSDMLSLIRSGQECIRNPNSLEAHLHSQIAPFAVTHPILLCFERSVAFCNPVNMVQAVLPNRSGQDLAVSVPVLMERFSLGFRVDVCALSSFTPSAPHAEVGFSYRQPELPWNILKAELSIRRFESSFNPHEVVSSSYESDVDVENLADNELYSLVTLLRDIDDTAPSSPTWIVDLAKRLMERRASFSEAGQAPFKAQLSTYRQILDEEAKKAAESAADFSKTIATYESLRLESQDWIGVLQSSLDQVKARVSNLESELIEAHNLIQAAEVREQVNRAANHNLEEEKDAANALAEISAARARKATSQFRELSDLLKYFKGRWWFRFFSWISRLSVFLKSIYRPKANTSDCKFKIEDVYIDSNGRFCVRGWHFLKKKKSSSVRVELKSWAKVRTSKASAIRRNDLAKKYPTRPMAGNSGFEIQTPLYRGWNTVSLQYKSGRKWIPFANYRFYGSRTLASQSNDIAKSEVVEHKLWNSEWPLVSIVIGVPFFDHPLAERSLNSIRSQTWSDFELIVVGDVKEAGVIEMVGNLKEKLRWIHCPDTNSLSPIWNQGAKKSKGKYLCFVESGIELVSTYLEKCLFEMESSGLDVCVAPLKAIGETESSIGREAFGLGRLAKSAPRCNCAVIERAFWSKVGGFNESLMDGSVVWWDFWVKSALNVPCIAIIPEALIHQCTPSEECEDAASKNKKEIRKRHRMLSFQQKIEGDLSFSSRKVLNPWVNLRRDTSDAHRRPSVLICLPHTVVGGSEKLISQISQGLVEEGFLINLITTHLPESSQGDSTTWFEKVTPGIYHFPRFLRQEEWKYFFLHLLHFYKVDALWIAGSKFTYDLLPEVKTAFPSIKVVDFLFNEIGHTGSNRRYDYCIDLTITENEAVRSWLLANGESEDRAKVIPSGVNLEHHQPIEKRALPFDVPNRTLVIGYFGRLSAEKGPEIFVKIAASFRGESRVQFILAGDGPMRDEIQDLIDRESLTDTLHFVGFGHLDELLPCCDIVLVPSHLDGRPVLVMEAAAVGIPVIASRIGGIGDMISNGNSGYLCTPGEVSEFVEKINSLLQDPDLLVEMKKNARDFAEVHFDMNRTIGSFAEVFRNLIELKIKE